MDKQAQRDIETLQNVIERAIKALEKQVPQKVKKYKGLNETACPERGIAFGYYEYDDEKFDYCYNCGQKLDWESEGEVMREGEERIVLYERDEMLKQIEALQQENEQLKKERDQAVRDIDKGNCRSCVYDGKKICYGNMHGKDREVAKEQGLPYCIGWQWRGLEGRE